MTKEVKPRYEVSVHRRGGYYILIDHKTGAEIDMHQAAVLLNQAEAK
jgi:hypothetical protein